MTHRKWQILHTEDVSPSKWFPVTKDFVRLPNGHETDFYVSRLANVAMTVPITQDNEIVFVRQYKHGVGEVCLEFPAGRIEQGKTPLQTAVAELREEAGIEIAESELQPIIELWAQPTKSSVRVYGFLATNVSLTGRQELEQTEAIEVVTVPISQIPELLASGELHASDTVALLHTVMHQRPQLFTASKT